MYYPEILEGACDIHIHTLPCLVPRELGIADMWHSARRAHMAAVVIKDHHYCTAPACSVVSGGAPADGTYLFGSVVLNSGAGGMSADVVETAIAFGAKIVWMPTVSAVNNISHAVKAGNPALKLSGSAVPVVDEDGKLLAQTVDVLKVLAEHPDVVLGCGHIDARETDAVLEKAFSLGLTRVFVDHPTIFGEISLEDMKRWAAMGAYIEHTASGSMPGSVVFHTHHSEIVEAIRAVGADHTIISSDAGQKGNGDPVEMLDRFMKLMEDGGIPGDDLEKMVKTNTRKLLGL